MTPEQIATSLTKAQREAVLAMPYFSRGFWRAVDIDLVNLGLTPATAKDVSGEQCTLFLVEPTFLGEQVRAILKAQQP